MDSVWDRRTSRPAIAQSTGSDIAVEVWLYSRKTSGVMWFESKERGLLNGQDKSDLIQAKVDIPDADGSIIKLYVALWWFSLFVS